MNIAAIVVFTVFCAGSVYLSTAWFNARHWVSKWRRNAATFRELAGDNLRLADTTGEALATTLDEAGCATLRRIASNSRARATECRAYAAKIDREADRMWTWPFTVREDAS